MALTLSSDTLSVSVLDPNSPSDDDKKGARYCTGGYIFQVRTTLPLTTAAALAQVHRSNWPADCRCSAVVAGVRQYTR